MAAVSSPHHARAANATQLLEGVHLLSPARAGDILHGANCLRVTQASDSSFEAKVST